MSASVSVRKKSNGKHEVRWRENGRHRGRTLSRKRDAERFAESVRRRLEAGGLVELDHEMPTLDEFFLTFWDLYAEPNLAKTTQAAYLQAWGKHIAPRLGALPLRSVTTGAIELQLVDPMRRSGVGEPSIIKVLGTLQSVMRLAVVHGHATANPVAAVRKPRQRRRDTVPIWPTDVERLRAELGRQDATMVSVMAYAGLRPEEVLGLEWKHVRDDGLVVEQAIVLGERRQTKTGADRVVKLLRPLAQDLAAWRLACGRPAAAKPVFPRRDGGTWTDSDWRNWRRRVFQPAATDAGLQTSRPYDLRASFVSLLIHEGSNLLDVAAQAGHTPETCLRHYARLFRDAPSERISAEAVIRGAREELAVASAR
ncbi:MAG: tyrosine-type recombinase/integrase [Baekduiaceae bacterium]